MNELFQIIAGVCAGFTAYYSTLYILESQNILYIEVCEDKTYWVIRRWGETKRQAKCRLYQKIFKACELSIQRRNK